MSNSFNQRNEQQESVKTMSMRLNMAMEMNLHSLLYAHELEKQDLEGPLTLDELWRRLSVYIMWTPERFREVVNELVKHGVIDVWPRMTDVTVRLVEKPVKKEVVRTR